LRLSPRLVTLLSRGSLLAAGKPYFLGVVVEVNPVSAEMVEQMRRWTVGPTGSTASARATRLPGLREPSSANRDERSDVTFRTQDVTP